MTAAVEDARPADKDVVMQDGEDNEFQDENVLQEMTVENRYAKNSKSSDNKSSSTALTTNSTSSNSPPVFSPELLRMYYSRLFPFHLLYSWLTYDPSCVTDPTKMSPLFCRREFSFTLESDQGEEIYLRYKCFNQQVELERDIQKLRPRKIDIGAVFDHAPKDHKSIKCTPQQRELVFDVDLTDYDEVRHCGCDGAKICPKCWTLMKMAVQVMDVGLKEDFGFQHVAWFYSGRRGVHAWVCDESARLLSNEARSAVASYFEVSLGTDKNNKVALQLPLHPMLQRAYATLEPMFVKNHLPASGHGLLATRKMWTQLLESLPEPAHAVRDNLLKKWNKDNTSTPAQKWTELKKHLTIFASKQTKTKAMKTMSSDTQTALELWPVATVFKYTYPRLDINVSKMQNHLLKSPFCVHPKTGRVCVPIPIANIESFDPFAVPTLGQLGQELDEYEKEHKDEKDSRVVHDWQKTSLKEHFEPFQKEFLEPLWKELRKAQRAKAEEKAAVTGDF